MASLFSGDKRIPTMSFYGYLFSAVAVDLVLSDWLPGSGTAFVTFCRGMYMINGYKTDKMTSTTVATAIVGIVPILADVSNIVFVVSTYMTNVRETKPLEEAGQQTKQSLAARAASAGNSYIAMKTGAGLTGAGKKTPANENGPSAGGSENKNTAHEQKETRGSVASAPVSAADKNIGYAQNKKVDGVVPAPSANDNVGYREAA